MQSSPPDHAALFHKGIEQFNRQEFFESHESWEVIWLAAPEPDKTFMQGIIQIAAALHHYRRKNRNGARSLLRRGLAKVESFPADYRGLNLEEVRSAARSWREHLTGRSEQPGWPQIRKS